jgi:uncharacterized iron-regulated membrane protein
VVRLLLWLHRYLGIAVGVLMAMWCLSGMVMMYVSYPALSENIRLTKLAPIVWRDCCQIGDEALSDAEPVSDFGIEMLAGRPVLALQRSVSRSELIDLSSGLAIGVSPQQARSVAESYVQAPSAVRYLGLMDYDEWTVAGELDAARPLYHFSLGDAVGSELYVSSRSGRAVQYTTAHERFWNWFGAVPHWLYFAQLRRQTQWWRQILIATSVLGCFLAVTGLYLGIRQWLHRPAGRWSPYRGVTLWHHAAGVIFGLLTLSWVLSGLLSMNPWGLLAGSSAQAERSALAGPPPAGGELKAALRALAAAHESNMAAIRSAPFDGRLFVIASNAQGERQRFNAEAQPASLGREELAQIATLLCSAQAPAPALLSQEDEYYFSHHHDVVSLPVYRIVSRDRFATRYYVDPESGELLAKVDRGAQGYRWWHQGLHRLDFSAPLRVRPRWDAVMLLLLAGVTLSSVTGVWLGYRRLVRRRT